MKDYLLDKLFRTPGKPGVYLMQDRKGDIIYVGKARNLKKRLSSYFRKNGPMDVKTGVLVKKIASFNTIITATEKEALILESTLIKRHKPRYNVILKDDKRYPSLRLDLKSPYPNLTIVRKTAGDGARYFGPFTSAQAVRQTLNVVQKTFKLRKCKTKEFKNRTRPCLNHQIGACLAPCCLNVSQQLYNEIVREVTLFLNGRTPDLIKKIQKQMRQAADSQDFETAATLRDKMFALEKTLEKQVSVTTDFVDRDVIGLAGSKGSSLVTLMAVRGGYLLGTRHFDFSDTISSASELVEAFIRQYYDGHHFVPKEILVSALPDDIFLIETWLSGIKGQKVSVKAPQRGAKARLLSMAEQNAVKEFQDRRVSLELEDRMLLRLQKRLALKRIPYRIECFDNSNISGKAAVSGMVAFERGRPDKASYRKYRIKQVKGHDDYAYMTEALNRRYGKNPDGPAYPDLLLVDGGKGQLNIAIAVLKEIQLDGRFDVVAIAKKDEIKKESEDKVFKPGRVNPVNFGREGDLLLYLQRIRDEAHRFAVSYHRKRRNRVSMRSALDRIPGVGKKRKEVLLKHFKSVNKIRAATCQEISALPGINRTIAENILKALSR